MKITKQHLDVAISYIAILAWGVGFASFFPMASIETKALSQPDHFARPYIKPMHLKGVVRYVTASQETEDRIAHVALVGGILSFAGCAVLLKLLKQDGNESP